MIKIALSVVALLTTAATLQDAPSFDSFMEYCEEDNNSDMALYTLDLLGEQAGSTRCKDIEAFLAQQKEITLKGGPISELTPLRFFPTIEKITVSSVVPMRVNQLKGIKNLKELILSGPVAEIGQISPALQTIVLNGAPGVDITHLHGNSSLATLAVHKSPGIDYGPLASVPTLTTLSITESELTDVDALPVLSSLDKLVLNGNGISSIAPLAAYTNLKHLVAESNKILDLSPLANLEKLFALNLTFNAVHSLAPLRDNTALEYLELGGNPLGTGIPKSESNCPTDAKAPAVATWCNQYSSL